MTSFPSLIVADIGNSRVKYALWKNVAPRDHIPEESFADPTPDLSLTSGWLGEITKSLTSSARWVISSVNRAKTTTLLNIVASTRPNDVVCVLTLNDIPIECQYDFPEKLGIDRVVAAFAAVKRVPPGTPFIVVDVGTAATVDYVDSHGVFRGGAILPGARLVAEALKAKTDALPFVEQFESTATAASASSFQEAILEFAPDYPATETQKAIRLGMVYSLVGAVTSFYLKTSAVIKKQQGDYAALELVFAGGDAALTEFHFNRFFDDLTSVYGFQPMKPRTTVIDNLVTNGLHDLTKLLDQRCFHTPERLHRVD
ncbi:MAG: type III pantothenate kinase [Planctomycetia bacterium]|nr:type III pantothenate kinase [Planctomycetia bacterium]